MGSVKQKHTIITN